MSWVNQGIGVQVDTRTISGGGTSTATVNIQDGVHELYMFGLSTTVLNADASLYHAAPTELPGDDALTSSSALLYFGSTSDSAPLFDLPGAGAPIKLTVIPNSRTATEWYYTLVYYALEGESPEDQYDAAEQPEATIETYTDADGNEYYNIRNLKRTFDVVYKDPSIVRLPQGSGLLMFMSRVRTAQDDPGFAIADIVAYWASDDCPLFDTAYTGGPVTADALDSVSGVVGPIWIARSIDALQLLSGTGEQSVESPCAGVRLTLSVPTGAYFETDDGVKTVAAYFVTQRPARSDVEGDQPDTSHSLPTSVLNTLYPFSSGNATEGEFSVCIAAHLFTLDDLLEKVALATSRTASDGSYMESVWAHTDYDSGATSYKATSRKYCLYTWLAGKDMRGEGVGIQMVDPQCVRCTLGAPTGDIESVRLFHAMLYPAERQGIWLTRPSDASATYTRADGVVESTIPGVDFDYIGTAPIISPSNNQNPIDPDPVERDDGTWVLFHGNIQGTSVGNLTYDLNADADPLGCASSFAATDASEEEEESDEAAAARTTRILPWLRPAYGVLAAPLTGSGPRDDGESDDTASTLRRLTARMPWLAQALRAASVDDASAAPTDATPLTDGAPGCCRGKPS